MKTKPKRRVSRCVRACPGVKRRFSRTQRAYSGDVLDAAEFAATWEALLSAFAVDDETLLAGPSLRSARSEMSA